MNRISKILTSSALAAAATAATVLPVAVADVASADSLPTAAVSLGDSFISGEGGRWAGNSTDGWDPDRDGTDRAHRSGWWGSWWYDYSSVYTGGSYDNGCNRSDVAEINSADIGVDAKFNLACSGAVTQNVIRAASGGQNFKGEAPQADQLAALAQNYDIELVVLSIGGNDLGFSDVITACVLAYSTNGAPCNQAQQVAVGAAMPNAMADVALAISEIQAALTSAGQAPGSYRFIIQSYPAPLPRAAENRYPESGWSRLHTGGCPMWNADADWARDTMVPAIDANLAAVAADAGVEFLSLASAFDGREACATASSLVNGDSDTPDSAKHEWVRFLVSGTIQGQLQESIHPNAFGQAALGTCLTLAWNTPSTDHACHNTPGQDASNMFLTANGPQPNPSPDPPTRERVRLLPLWGATTSRVRRVWVGPVRWVGAGG